MFKRNFVILQDRVIVTHNYFLAVGIHNTLLLYNRISYLTSSHEYINPAHTFIYLSCVEYMYDMLAGLIPINSTVYVCDGTVRFGLMKTLNILQKSANSPVISVIHHNENPMELIKKIAHFHTNKNYIEIKPEKLTNMECQVFKLLLQGHDIHHVSVQIRRKPKRVYGIKAQIMLKLGIDNFDYFYLLIRPVRKYFIKQFCCCKLCILE